MSSEKCHFLKIDKRGGGGPYKFRELEKIAKFISAGAFIGYMRVGVQKDAKNFTAIKTVCSSQKSHQISYAVPLTA